MNRSFRCIRTVNAAAHTHPHKYFIYIYILNQSPTVNNINLEVTNSKLQPLHSNKSEEEANESVLMEIFHSELVGNRLLTFCKQQLTTARSKRTARAQERAWVPRGGSIQGSHFTPRPSVVSYVNASSS